MKKKLPKADVSKEAFLVSPLLQEIKHMIVEARTTVAIAVNATLTMLYWRIGQRIHHEILKDQRAEYGQKILATLSQELKVEFGSGFSTKNLRHMVRFAEAFPSEEKVSTLWRELSWSHFKSLIYLKDPLQQEFYTQNGRCAEV
jgi:hypothetical protein